MKHKAILIGIAGGTGSGKTKLARELLKEYGPGEVVVIEQDSYYNDLSDLPEEKRIEQNFDHPDAFEFNLLINHLEDLLGWKKVDVPIYDFSTHTRLLETRSVDPHHVIVLEGIMVLVDPALRDLMDIKVYVETPADIRFIRRLTRDRVERERSTQSVIDQYLSTVRSMHEQFVEPSKLFADIIVPEGGENTVAIDLIRTKISSIIPK
ncbi:MAG: uridine kinase [Candidatus Marinimicrobia bacterium]|nr:uridine kinase [Candidatus Neomarinimicrobiota bacterium]MDP6789094.1 uridine kinase [Candidatus Neomarinimicrobiota bacterium]MDP7071880.1 uridine kinase [Candidatus Neomarinimicrobiota bacterium]